jgi:hypothetical protein
MQGDNALMAKFNLELPTEMMNDLKKIYDNSDEIFGEMTRAGAEVVEDQVKVNAPEVLKTHVKVSRTYKTPTDGGINTKVYLSGYIPFSDPNRKYFSRSGGSGKKYVTSDGVPADFLANIYEYGRSNAPFPKKPFLRKSFKKDQIEKAMLEAQKKASGGILDE